MICGNLIVEPPPFQKERRQSTRTGWKRISKKLKAGTIYVNGNGADPGAPFGGYKQSGNGREGGTWGLHEFLEVKTITHWPK